MKNLAVAICWMSLICVCVLVCLNSRTIVNGFLEGNERVGEAYAGGLVWFSK